MSDSTPLPPNDSRAEAVWPPPPIEPIMPAGSPPEQPAAFGDIREFDQVGVWNIFLYLVMTLGLYTPFWMLRMAKVINRVIPDRKIPRGVIWMFFFVSLGDTALRITLANRPPAGPALDLIWLLSDTVFVIYYFYLVFRFRGALNTILDRTSPHLAHFNWFGTLVLGILSLQLELNKHIERRILETYGPG